MDVLRKTHGEVVVRSESRALNLLHRLRAPAIPLKGVIFDLCGVLYDDSAWQRWLLRLLTRLGLHTNELSFFRLWRREYLSRVGRGGVDYWTALRQFLAACGLSSGQVDEVEAAAHARWCELQEEVYPLPNVPQTINKLRNHGIRLGLVCSDWLDRDTVRRRLVRLHLQRCFDWVVVAADLPESDNILLRTAVSRLQLPTARIAYVGRDTHCLRTAARLGLHAVAFNHDEDAIAAVYVNSFSELLHQMTWDAPVARAG